MIASFMLVALAASTPCDGLKSVTLPNTMINVAQLVPAGSYTPPAPAAAPGATMTGRGAAADGRAQAPAGGRSGRDDDPARGGGRGGPAAAVLLMLPAHCRVNATLVPSPDSQIEVELWLPVDNWNGKFQAVGN